MKNPNGTAFTILEILITISIILILAALIFPVFGGARHRAIETVCISNMRQIYAAAQLYKADHDAYPPNSILLQPWRPYLSNDIAFGCKVNADNPGREGTGDYLVQFRPESMDEKAGTYRQCAEIRGGDFPVVLDINHLQSRVGKQSGRRVLLLCRDNGAVVSILGERLAQYTRDPSSFPCPFLSDPYTNQ